MAKKTLSSADSSLFRQTVGKVKPISADTLVLKTTPIPKPVPKAQAVIEEAQLENNLDFIGEKLSVEDTLSFIAPGLQKNVLKKMRQGYFGLDAEIDLHGLTSREAKQQLLHFLHACVEDGCRCVHIIHGKGYRSQNNHPVLKNQLNIWLRQHNDVQAFCSASPRHGGAGAVLVLLHLSKKYQQDF